ncbi:MAG: peptidylprolyl isomerase [Bacteroidetes bacterium QH_9_64_21]|nr:MAG: peptidylprolyl isomerase [Bacteroidetes bacterium QH_9_64_21]
MDVPKTVIAALLLCSTIAACSTMSPTDAPETTADSSPESPVVARYADTAITLTELDSAFAESAGGPENAADSSLSAYREFLDQYVNFRLKIRAARDAGLDTLPSIRQDVQSYRQELARPGLLREEVYEPVARTLYERRNQAVDVSHILIRTSSDQDTLSAYRTARSIADSLEQEVPFDELAYRNSEDPSAQKEGSRGYKGRLGYIRAGQIVQPFENRMYAVEPGEVSDVFRTKYGYHILKVHDRRPAKRPVQLSHILRRPSGDASPRQFLDSLRTVIREGDLSFAAAAKKHSEDRKSSQKGGRLGEVNPQGLPESLREAVTELDSVGALSDVVKSRFGYHLLKLTGRQEKQTFEERYDALKKKVADQPRAEERKAAFAAEVRAEEGVSVDTTRLLELAGTASVDSLARPLLSRTGSASGPDDPVATLGDSTYTPTQMAQHLMQTDGGAQKTIGELIDSFLNEKAIDYAVTRRAQRDPTLAQQVKTYREGALLFRYMQDSVWTAAAQDSAGLRDTYRENRDQYQLPERVRTVALRAPADSLLHPYEAAYDDGRSLGATVAAATEDSLVSVDTLFVSDDSPDVYQPVRSVDDLASVGPTAQDNEWLLMIRDTQLPSRPKRFSEAHSSVVQDHQEGYEQNLIQQLRERYDVETYPERLRSPLSDRSSSQ